MTGRSAGHSTTTDVDGNMYVVGGFKTTSANAQFSGGNTSTGIIPSPLGLASESAGYLVKYDPITANPIASVVILPNNAACSFYSGSGVYADAQKVIVARGGHIYVLGVFFGCSIDLYNPSGGFEFSAHQPNIQPDQKQSVFLAQYDNNMIPISCHVFTSEECADKGLAADVAFGYNDYNSIFMAANFCGEAVWAERFPSGPQPVPPYDQLPINTFSTANPAEYQIYVGQIDRASDQLIYAIEMGRGGQDLASELSSGYLGSALDLYMSGTFTDSITFIKTGSGSTSYMSNGKWDLFSVRFNGFDLNSQDEAVAGGPLNDQALALSDDGKYVGGFISEWANFPGVGVITGIGAGPYPLINSGFKQQGFIAIPNYLSHNWIWQTDVVDNGLPNVLDSQVNDISNGDCDDFYVAWNRGMMSRPLDLPQVLWTHPTLNDMNTTQLHLGTYSRIEKWEDLGASATNLWQHDFNAAPNPVYNLSTGPIGSGAAVKARFVSDIQVRSQVSIGAPGDEDVLFTGRFGDDMTIDNAILSGPALWTTPWNSYDGINGGAFVHNEVGMFCGTLDEHPDFTKDTFEFCFLDDPFLVPWDFVPGAPFTYPFTVGSEISFSGPGVDPATGVFDPAIAGIGMHSVWLHLDYYGCTSSHEIAKMIVEDDPYPRQPIITNPADMAEGLAAAGISADELFTLDNNFSNSINNGELYFLAGKFDGQIQFERVDNSMITLNSSNEAGYIVAYGPCGAYWAVQVDGGTNDYIEALEMNFDNGGHLYATGSVGLNTQIEIINSEGAPIPLSTTNGYALNTFSGTIQEKGIIMELNPITGEVNWVYLGGNITTETNRFHDLKVADGVVGVAGEWAGAFNSGGVNIGGYDPFIVAVNQTNGVFMATSVPNAWAPDGFGTAGDDHGDALDAMVKASGPYFFMTGELAGATVTQNFFSYSSFSTTVSNDVFISSHDFNTGTGVMDDTFLKIYNSTGTAFARDIRLAVDNTGTPDPFFGNNQVFISGTFAQDFQHDFGTMNASSNPTNFDAFIGCTDFALNDQWFSHEGRNAPFTTESVNSLEIAGKKLYAYGMMHDVNNVSEFWNSTTPMSPSLLNGFGTTLFHDIFTLAISPNGSLSNINFSFPSNSGVNTGEDITALDTSLVLAGSTRMISVGTDVIDFMRSSNVHHTLDQNSNVSDAYIGRAGLSNLGYYKRGENEESELTSFSDGYRVFPNPNNGNFVLEFEKEFSGEMVFLNFLGQPVLHATLTNETRKEIVLNQPSGIYIYSIHSDRDTFSGKVIIQ